MRGDIMQSAVSVFTGAWQPLPDWVWRRLIRAYVLSFGFGASPPVWEVCDGVG